MPDPFTTTKTHLSKMRDNGDAFTDDRYLAMIVALSMIGITAQPLRPNAQGTRVMRRLDALTNDLKFCETLKEVN